MFGLNQTDVFLLCHRPCDMRKSFDGLCGMVKQHMEQDPCCGKVFIFINKSSDKMKLLHWQPGGFVLYYKRLEKGTFQLPRYDMRRGSIRMSYAQLVLLIDGISIRNTQKSRRFSSTKRSVKV